MPTIIVPLGGYRGVGFVVRKKRRESKNIRNKGDLSRERESSEQFVWYGETEMQLRRWAIRLSIQANRHQDEGI
jgi:hypothetical protein